MGVFLIIGNAGFISSTVGFTIGGHLGLNVSNELSFESRV